MENIADRGGFYVGYYSEYLDTLKNYDELVKERKKQLKKIAEIRGNTNILTIASDYMKAKAPISLDYSDLLPIADQIENLPGEEIDIILETPGGSGEVAEDIVRIIRNKFSKVGFIIPGWCKSAGTIMALSGDEILMDESSALGPIDAQIYRKVKYSLLMRFLKA
jgi:ClpP class serine protease